MHIRGAGTQVTERDHMDEDEFRWAYAIMRSDSLDPVVLQYFDRIQTAQAELEKLKAIYPDIPFGIYVQGDQLYVPNSAHEKVH
jgi:hypothetical protein